MTHNKFIVASYYKFQTIKNVFSLKNKFNKYFKGLDLKGIVIIAQEGININVSFTNKEEFLKRLNNIIVTDQDNIKFSYHNSHIFKKLKIKVKREILTTRYKDLIDPSKSVGHYVKADNWDNFIKDPEVLLIDTRNYYEIKLGSFKNSINPECKNFTEIIEWLENKLLKRKGVKEKKIAMFCTGGIRCEKATSIVKNAGHKNVFHLEGGILKYLEKKKKSMNWSGECFVFDDRVSVKNNMKKGSYDICHACRMPISEDDKKLKSYEKGLSCKYCFGSKTVKQIIKYKIRHNQSLSRKKSV